MQGLQGWRGCEYKLLMLVFLISDKLASWKNQTNSKPSDLSKADVVPVVEIDAASSSSFFAEVPNDVASSPSASQAEDLLTDSPAPKEAPLPPTAVGFSPAASSPGRAPGEVAPKQGERRDGRGKTRGRTKEVVKRLLGLGLLAPPSARRLLLLSISRPQRLGLLAPLRARSLQQRLIRWFRR